MSKLTNEIVDKVRSVPDFPKRGVVFRDTTPLLRDKVLFNKIIKHVKNYYKDSRIKYVITKDMQGLLWGGAIAHALKIGIIPMYRKDTYGKCLKTTYAHEYNPKRTILLQHEAIKQGDRVLIVDYMIATGNTMRNMSRMIEKLGGRVVGIFSVLELRYLNPRKGLEKFNVHTLVKYKN